MEQVVQEMLDSGIPYDAQYGDIDYMDEKRDFTYDPVAFAGFPEFVQKLQNHYNMHYIVILDPGTCSILVKACLKEGFYVIIINLSFKRLNGTKYRVGKKSVSMGTEYRPYFNSSRHLAFIFV